MRSGLAWALLALLGIGVIAGGCGSDGKECGEGTIAMGDRCVPESTVTCGTGGLPEPLDHDARSVVLEERALDDLLDGIDLDSAPRRPRTKREPGLH